MTEPINVSYYSDWSSEFAFPPSCCIGIELTRQTSIYNVSGRPQGWRMLVSVTRWEGVDPNIFLYRVAGTDPFTGNTLATFEGLASPLQLEEWPVETPAESGAERMFRLSQIDLVFNSMIDLETAWREIREGRDELVRTLITMCELQVDQIDLFGCLDSESSEESSEED